MFISHIISIAFIIILILNAFDVEFAHEIIRKAVYSPKSSILGLIAPASLTISFIHLSAKAVTNLENHDPTEEKPDVTLTDQQKNKINDAVSAAQNSQQDKTKPLSSIIGLDNVKQQINELKHFIVAQEKRKLVGLPIQKLNLHLVFKGNPGTGKTTVAREIAKIYKSYGLLEKGHLVETDRSGLVGEYMGQTAIKTNKIISKAMGGILFIDEAYALIGDQYGQEAIDILLKVMEDKKGKFAVIVAGYPKEMESFVNSNPGLKSRFGRFFNFQDYTHNELLQIFELFCGQEGFLISDEARNSLANHLVQSAPIGEKGFGNGRYIRNLFENVIIKQSERISKEKIVDTKELQEITAEDIQKVINQIHE